MDQSPSREANSRSASKEIPRPLWKAHPASYPVGTRALSLGVKRPGCEDDHSLPFSNEFKE
jgi:hypothetical protein